MILAFWTVYICGTYKYIIFAKQSFVIDIVECLDLVLQILKYKGEGAKIVIVTSVTK
jgi:hypothetical protein